LTIAKQNMTTLIDKLTQDGLVERRNDINDRRIINIILTERGIEFLKESRSALIKIIKKNLSELGNEDITSLDSAFQTIRAVLIKLDKNDRTISDRLRISQNPDEHTS
jgi:DNA-binding MarR family transcriptional regulator